MSPLESAVIATSRKENERRLPIHPRHLADIPQRLRGSVALEVGYGDRFGRTDRELREMGFQFASRAELLATRELVIMPKPLASDLAEMSEGAVLWGWPHCVQQSGITQQAIDRRLTVLAFEAMYHWSREGARELHTFYKNNELAGYCGVLHALELAGWDGFYGPARSVAVLGFGSVSRGAVYALQGRGFSDIAVYTQRPPHLVRDQVFGCRYRQMLRGAAPGEPMRARREDGSERALIDELAAVDLVVNGTLQDTDRPLMYLQPGEEERLPAGSLIVDVSCDEGMGFPFARPTSFDKPTFRVGGSGQVLYYAVDHSPSYLWESSTWEVSSALMPYLTTVLSGPEAWEREPTLARSIEIRDGVIQNPKILSFQCRAAEYPHGVEGE